eukprot:snap_masked-scaffold_3-processed-gene-4.25-mRNA-1 protein AED:1.00 eAED:1.00 QI:0/0/0/0/1/1/3/0/629
MYPRISTHNLKLDKGAVVELSKLSSEGTCKVLSLSGHDLGTKIYDLIDPLLNLKALISLNLSKNSLTNEEAVPLLQSVFTSNTLKNLNIAKNNINSDIFAKMLNLNLTSCQVLRMDLSHNPLDENLVLKFSRKLIQRSKLSLQTHFASVSALFNKKNDILRQNILQSDFKIAQNIFKVFFVDFSSSEKNLLRKLSIPKKMFKKHNLTCKLSHGKSAVINKAFISCDEFESTYIFSKGEILFALNTCTKDRIQPKTSLLNKNHSKNLNTYQIYEKAMFAENKKYFVLEEIDARTVTSLLHADNFAVSPTIFVVLITNELQNSIIIEFLSELKHRGDQIRLLILYKDEEESIAPIRKFVSKLEFINEVCAFIPLAEKNSIWEVLYTKAKNFTEKKVPSWFQRALQTLLRVDSVSISLQLAAEYLRPTFQKSKEEVHLLCKFLTECGFALYNEHSSEKRISMSLSSLTHMFTERQVSDEEILQVQNMVKLLHFKQIKKHVWRIQKFIVVNVSPNICVEFALKTVLFELAQTDLCEGVERSKKNKDGYYLARFAPLFSISLFMKNLAIHVNIGADLEESIIKGEEVLESTFQKVNSKYYFLKIKMNSSNKKTKKKKTSIIHINTKALDDFISL